MSNRRPLIVNPPVKRVTRYALRLKDNEKLWCQSLDPMRMVEDPKAARLLVGAFLADARWQWSDHWFAVPEREHNAIVEQAKLLCYRPSS